MDQTTVTVNLGIEELLFLLDALKIRHFLGLGLHPLADADEVTARKLLAAGYHSLRARELVSLADREGQPTIEIETALIAMLGTCVSARRLAILARAGGEIVTTSYAHFGEHVAVLHHLPESGLHTLAGCTDASVVADMVLAQLDLEDRAAPEAEPLALPTSDIQRVLSALREEGANASAGQGSMGQNRQALADILDGLQASSLFAFLDLDRADDGQGIRGASVVDTDDGLWWMTLEDHGGSTALASFEPISGEACRERLTTMLASSDETA